jgi:hypothetical protein
MCNNKQIVAIQTTCGKRIRLTIKKTDVGFRIAKVESDGSESCPNTVIVETSYKEAGEKFVKQYLGREVECSLVDSNFACNQNVISASIMCPAS